MEKKPVNISELMDALEFDSTEHMTKLDLQTGRLVMVEDAVIGAVEEGDDETVDDIAEWQKEELKLARAIAEDSGERFVDPPDKFEFHEYRHMEQFIGTLDDNDAAEQLWRAIKGKGAFRYYKDTAHRLGLLDDWYQYREDAMKEFVKDWAEANKVQVVDDVGRSERSEELEIKKEKGKRKK
ncbi:MAG TPA: UPF0158 family protein [Candidatus Sulfotelmatobacter sp.]|nr:UPF0158 family protein [Candidatus Sulfotelmatobacter sp.]